MIDDDANELRSEIEQLKKLIQDEPKLNVRTDDNFLLRHLRAAEKDPKKAFDKMRHYYQLKRDHPDWYACDSPIVYKELLDMGTDYVLEGRDKIGKRIWISRLAHVDTSKMSISQISQIHDLILETILDEPETQKKGLIVVTDMKDVPWSLMRWATPANLKMSARKADSLPFPKIEYHVVNPSLFFTILHKLVYPFMSAKQKEELFVHSTFESLHEKVNREALPQEYGGDLPNVIDHEKLHSVIYNYSEQLTANVKLGYT